MVNHIECWTRDNPTQIASYEGNSHNRNLDAVTNTDIKQLMYYINGQTNSIASHLYQTLVVTIDKDDESKIMKQLDTMFHKFNKKIYNG